MVEMTKRGCCIDCYGNDIEGCVSGRIYGYCSSTECDGLCDYIGPCPCNCHKEVDK